MHFLCFTENTDTESETPSKTARINFEYNFSQTGEWIAVFYTDQDGKPYFVVGEVIEVLSETEASVNYLQQCRVRETLFKVPDTTDFDAKVKKNCFRLEHFSHHYQWENLDSSGDKGH